MLMGVVLVWLVAVWALLEVAWMVEGPQMDASVGEVSTWALQGCDLCMLAEVARIRAVASGGVNPAALEAIVLVAAAWHTSHHLFG